MKIGDLIWDKYCNEPVVLLKKETNVCYSVFSTIDGVISVNRKSLTPITPKFCSNKSHNYKRAT